MVYSECDNDNSSRLKLIKVLVFTRLSPFMKAESVPFFVAKVTQRGQSGRILTSFFPDATAS